MLRGASHRCARNDGENHGPHRFARNDDDGAALWGRRPGGMPTLAWACPEDACPCITPWPRFAWPCHPTTGPHSPSSRPEGRRPAVEGPVRTALPQGTMPQHTLQRGYTLISPPSPQRHAATATAVSLRDAEKRIPRSALGGLGMTMLGPPCSVITRFSLAAPGGMPTLAWTCPGHAGPCITALWASFLLVRERV